ncbi:MAG: hypothetical protein LBL28_02895, partial [Treponema sp.]|nr:hypothetical protein [Treponema sp.]
MWVSLFSIMLCNPGCKIFRKSNNDNKRLAVSESGSPKGFNVETANRLMMRKNLFSGRKVRGGGGGGGKKLFLFFFYFQRGFQTTYFLGGGKNRPQKNYPKV